MSDAVTFVTHRSLIHKQETYCYAGVYTTHRPHRKNLDLDILFHDELKQGELSDVMVSL